LTSFTAIYAITQADINSGRFYNNALACGFDEGFDEGSDFGDYPDNLGDGVVCDDDDHEEPLTPPPPPPQPDTPGIDIEKWTNGENSDDAPGQ